MHFIALNDFTENELYKILRNSMRLKNLKLSKPHEFEANFGKSMKNKTLLMLFEKPSLRTRVSFEVGMTLLGGHAIYYDIATSPLGKKESISDFAKVSSRYVDIIMARLFKHSDILELADKSSIPVINALTDFSHPCQIMADLLTIMEKKGDLKGLKLTYFGDSNNNVTHSLLYGCSIMGMDITVGCPADPSFMPLPEVLDWAVAQGNNSEAHVVVEHDPIKAAKDADVIYTDSWLSYHIDSTMEEERKKILLPYQVNSNLMSNAKPDAVFMNCLPAMRGYEQTADVIDGPQSIVFDQAENRLYAQIGIMLDLLNIN